MNLKRELVKTGNYFFQPVLHLQEWDLDAFSGKPFTNSFYHYRIVGIRIRNL